MGHSESSADITRSDSLVCHLHDPLSDHVRQGSAVNKDSTKLVDAAVTWKKINHQVITSRCIYKIKINCIINCD